MRKIAFGAGTLALALALSLAACGGNGADNAAVANDAFAGETVLTEEFVTPDDRLTATDNLLLGNDMGVTGNVFDPAPPPTLLPNGS